MSYDIETDDRYVDYDFNIDIQDEDSPFLGGCDPRSDTPGQYHKLFSRAFAVVPRKEWEPQEADESARAVSTDDEHNQKHEGSCTAFGIAMNFQICWARTFGKANRILVSPMSTFKRCASSSRGGSSISCNMRHARDTGYCLRDTPEMKDWMRDQGLNDRHVLPPVGYGTRYPQDWAQTAQYFRFAETWEISSFEEFVSALLYGFSVSYGRAGHSICAVRYVQYQGRPAVEYRNSWGNTWNGDGHGVDTERAIAPAIQSYGAIATRTVVIPDLPFVTAQGPDE